MYQGPRFPKTHTRDSLRPLHRYATHAEYVFAIPITIFPIGFTWAGIEAVWMAMNRPKQHDASGLLGRSHNILIIRRDSIMCCRLNHRQDSLNDGGIALNPAPECLK